MLPVLTLGETMILVTPTHREPLETAAEFRLDIGGSESNTASHLVRLGVPARWAGAVGDDPLGRRLLATLSERGVDISLVHVDPHAPTALYLKDPGAVTSSVYYYRSGSAGSLLGPDFASRLRFDDASAVHLSGITPALSGSCAALVDEVIRLAHAARVPISFDVNYRPALWRSCEDAAAVLLDLARRADLVFVGRDEGEALWGTPTADEIGELLQVSRLVVKDGATGAHSIDRRGRAFVDAPVVEVVEPVGAGDAFAAGFLAADLGGAPAEDALAAGHSAAARALVTTGDYGDGET